MTAYSCVEVLIVKYSPPMTTCSCAKVLTVKYSLPMTTCSCAEVLTVKYSLPMTTCSCVEVLTVKYSPPMTMCSCTGVLIASLDWFELVSSKTGCNQLATGRQPHATSCHQFWFWLPTFGNFKRLVMVQSCQKWQKNWTKLDF